MDVRTAIRRIFRAYAGVAPDTMGDAWQCGITEEIECLRADENGALQEIARALSLCSSGAGWQATGVEDWANGAIVLLHILAARPTPAVQAFLRDTAFAGGATAAWARVRAEAQRLTPPVSYAPMPVGMPTAAPRVNAAKARRRPTTGLLLPIVILFAAWLLALTDGGHADVCPNAILGVSAPAYCLLLGCTLSLFYRRRYVPGAVAAVCGALLSALSLGWTKIMYIGSDMRFFSMLGIPQLWTDFLVALLPAALLALCALLIPRLFHGATDRTVALAGGLTLFACSTITMLLTLPRTTLLAALFSVFAGLMLGAFCAAAALLAGDAAPDPKRRMALSGGATAWFSVCIAIDLAVCVIFWDIEEFCVPVFSVLLILAQMVMLIRLLCKRRQAYIWYAAASAAVVFSGLMYFLLAFVVSASWLPLVLAGTLICAIGPSIGYFLIRRSWNASPVLNRPGGISCAAPVGPRYENGVWK